MSAAKFGLGILMCVVGVVWFFQGINVIKGSFMTGQFIWSIFGAVMIFLGSRLVLKARAAA